MDIHLRRLLTSHGLKIIEGVNSVIEKINFASNENRYKVQNREENSMKMC